MNDELLDEARAAFPLVELLLTGDDRESMLDLAVDLLDGTVARNLDVDLHILTIKERHPE